MQMRMHNTTGSMFLTRSENMCQNFPEKATKLTFSSELCRTRSTVTSKRSYHRIRGLPTRKRQRATSQTQQSSGIPEFWRLWQQTSFDVTSEFETKFNRPVRRMTLTLDIYILRFLSHHLKVYMITRQVKYIQRNLRMYLTCWKWFS